MELKEGMYVRTKYGITQYKEYDTTQGKIICMPVKNGIEGIFANIEDVIGEPSYNIIDLIKKDDLILGKDGKMYQCQKIYEDYVFTCSKNKQGQTITLVDYQIDKILTKEQFEREAYKL